MDVTIEGVLKNGAKLLVYEDPRLCALCGNLRMLHVDQEGARLCFLCFEKLGFQVSAGGK